MRGEGEEEEGEIGRGEAFGERKGMAKRGEGDRWGEEAEKWVVGERG